MPMKNPPHPGDFIRTEIIEAAGLSVTAAAAVLQVSRPALSSLLNGKADLSGEMALRMEKAFGVKMDTLMRMQSNYDIAETRKREKEIRVGEARLEQFKYQEAERQLRATLNGFEKSTIPNDWRRYDTQSMPSALSRPPRRNGISLAFWNGCWSREQAIPACANSPNCKIR